MGTAESIQAPLERVHAYQHIRKALKEALPLLEASAFKLAEDIGQTKLDVSTAKKAVDEHNSNARSAAASVATGESGADDADLAEGLIPSKAQKDTHDALDVTYKSEVIKLGVLNTRHTTILSHLSLWTGTLQEIKRRIDKRKREYNKNKKRANPGTSVGSTDVDLTDVNEWVISSSSRALSQRVRDPLHAINPYDRLAAKWAEQPLGQEHPFIQHFAGPLFSH
jgi:hypothetical protein